MGWCAFPPPSLSSVCLPIISYGGLTVSGGGSMTVRAAALQRTDRLQTSVRVLGKAIGLLSPIRGNFPETSAVVRSIFEPQPPRLEDEVKRKLRSGASRIRWSSAFCLVHRPARCSTSLCCGKRGNGSFHATGAQRYFML